VRFIGRGGMGAVYLCEDLRLPGKRWALKEMILHDPGVAEQVRDSFIREARFLAGLRHRSLPTIVDVFSIKTRQYLVMEFIEGQTLAQKVESEGVPSDTLALSWALELAQVLDYLHRQDRPIIFRDLKPENIMINEEGHVKVIDFGLARHFEPGKRRDTQASGTVGYAPPEQWEDSGQSDPRSDIYSLAATLFFVLTGRPPSPIYGSHRIRPYRPDIDPGIEALVLKCLQPDPTQRYGSAAELIKDLLMLLSEDKHQGAMRLEAPSTHEPARIPSPLSRQKASSLRRPHSFPRRLPSLLGIGLVLFLVGLLLPFVNLESSARTPRNKASDHFAELMAETDPLKREVRLLMGQGKYKEAIAKLDDLCARYPDDPEALILKNNAYAEFSKLETYRLPVLSSWHGAERGGIQLLYGFGLAQTQLNRRRIGKKPLLVLQLYDDRSNNESLLNIVSELASDIEVPLILGPFTSQQTRLIAPLANSKGLPVLAPVASDPQVFSTGRYIFSASDTDTKKIQTLAAYMHRTGNRNAAVFSNSASVISRSWSDAFVETFQAEGGLIASTEDYPNNQVDFSRQIREARTQGADCIFLAEYRIPPVISFCESLQASGWKPTVGANTAVFSESLFRRGEQVVDGLLLSTYYVPDRGDKESKAFNREFRQTFDGRKPTHREANSYDALFLATEAIDSVGLDREKLREYFTSIGDTSPSYKGISGEFALNRTLGARTAYILKAEHGTYKLVDAETFEVKKTAH
jgi:serine/threonine protein kinase/ABC-type branched-subunit amino acid transport system substrate-binding protein